MTIGITIAALLRANADLLALVNTNNIFPYVADENTPLPMVVYTIDSLEPDYDKDGWNWDECSFSVVSFSEDYANLQLIATQVRTALELQKVDDTNKIYLTGQSEGYDIGENVFLNKLTFSVVINNY
jgi:hypothetical protein